MIFLLKGKGALALKVYNVDFLTHAFKAWIFVRAVNDNGVRLQHVKEFFKACLKKFSVFMVVETARNCSDGNDTVVRYALEAPAESFFLAPTNIVNDRTAEFTVPVAESSHSISIENFPGKREVEIGREIGRDNPREVTKNFCRSPRRNPYAAASPVEFVVVLIKMNKGVYEKIFVAALNTPIVSCSRLGVRDELARKFMGSRRAKRNADTIRLSP